MDHSHAAQTSKVRKFPVKFWISLQTIQAMDGTNYDAFSQFTAY